ncbi:hypothetical protein MPSEU_000961800 [Mayamaea pseudoterrestris]|nr:hypothetical protein MPSEU_000961800 [Mayamaea pseudoterrestris]
MAPSRAKEDQRMLFNTLRGLSATTQLSKPYGVATLATVTYSVVFSFRFQLRQRDGKARHHTEFCKPKSSSLSRSTISNSQANIMVRRLAENGHVKRSIKIPDVFLANDAKPIRSMASPHTPVLPYLAMAEFAKQREHDIRESMAQRQAKESAKVAVQEATNDGTMDKLHNNEQLESTCTTALLQAPESINSQPINVNESNDHQEEEPNHFTARRYQSKPIPWSDRKGTSAPRPDETQAFAVQQGRYTAADEVASLTTPVAPAVTESPLRPAPGEVYINEQGRRVRLVKKVQPRQTNEAAKTFDGTPTKPRKAKSNSPPRQGGAPNSPSKSKGNNSNPSNSTGPNKKKRRKKPRTYTDPNVMDYPTSIGIPSDLEERSVQSELNMLSLGDLTPMEMAKMDPPLTPPCTPDSKDSTTSRTMSFSTRTAGRNLFGSRMGEEAEATDAVNCNCVIM